LVLVPKFFTRNFWTPIWFWYPVSLQKISEHQFGFGAQFPCQKFLNTNLVLLLNEFLWQKGEPRGSWLMRGKMCCWSALCLSTDGLSYSHTSNLSSVNIDFLVQKSPGFWFWLYWFSGAKKPWILILVVLGFLLPKTLKLDCNCVDSLVQKRNPQTWL
jgi:hypothetical protein